MSSPESDPKTEAEDEDDLLYLMIFEMKTHEKEVKETVKSPQRARERPEPLIIDAESDSSEDETTQTQEQKDQEVDNTKRPEMDNLDSIQKTPVKKAKAKVRAKARAKAKAKAKAKDKKPWRKPGADITDYFNYGFDEESWNAYCRRQSQSRATRRKLNIMRGHTSHKEEEFCSAPPFSGSQPTLASRESSPTTDFIGGQSSGRKEQCQCLNVTGNNTQEDTKMSPEDPVTSNDLRPPSNVTMKKLLCPQSYLYRKGPPPPSPRGALYRLDKGSDDPSTSVSPCPSGVSSVILGKMTSRVGWTEAATAWECFIHQEMCEQDCDRFRQHCLGKDSKRGSDRHRDRTSSSHSSHVHMCTASKTCCRVTDKGKKTKTEQRMRRKKKRRGRRRKRKQSVCQV